jgi:hypothetical protein
VGRAAPTGPVEGVLGFIDQTQRQIVLLNTGPSVLLPFRELLLRGRFCFFVACVSF